MPMRTAAFPFGTELDLPPPIRPIAISYIMNVTSLNQVHKRGNIHFLIDVNKKVDLTHIVA